MKHIILLLISLCSLLTLHAQVTKSVTITPGSLITALTDNELNTVTHLTIAGNIDARDFKTLRDNMPLLTDIDMKEAHILAYTGTLGTSFLHDYAADVVPTFAFLNDMTGGKKSLKSIWLPFSAKGIDGSAFEDCAALTYVELPPNLVYLGQAVFAGCTSLISIFLPPSIQSFEINIFARCTSLVSIVLPPSIKKIPQQAFWRCSSLTSIEIPSTVTSIELNAFFNCTSLKTVQMPSTITTIEWNAFYGCSSLETLTLPTSLVDLGEGAFEGCISWKGPLNLPAGLSAINNRTFFHCQSLTSVTFPETLSMIGESAFESCTGLTGSLHLPSAITTIGQRAFYNCGGLSDTLLIPPMITTVDNYTFAGCRSFSSLIIPASVTTIGAGAFKDCSGLNTVTALSSLPVPIEEVMEVFDGVDKSSVSLRVPFGTREIYASANGWKAFTHMVENTQGIHLSTNSLTFGADRESSNIHLEANVAWMAVSDQMWLTINPASGNNSQDLTITARANEERAARTAIITVTAEGIAPQVIHVRQESMPTIVTVAPGSLSNALSTAVKQSITSLTLTGRMDARDFKTIRDEMPNLEILDISAVTIAPYTDTTYGHQILYPANTMPGNISDMVDQAYTNYSLARRTRLTTVRLPTTLTDIAFEAFRGCTILTTIELPPTLREIRLRAFMECSKLSAIVMPPSLTFLGSESFSNCSSLAKVELSSQLTSIPTAAFSMCNALKTIQFPPSVTNIEEGAFAGCSQLQFIELPPALTNISRNAFMGCTSLTSVVIPSSVTVIDRMAFSDCTSLSELSIPASVTSIKSLAFQNCTLLQAIYVYNNQPIGLENAFGSLTFENVDKTRCILFVPQNSRDLYAKATEWKDFTNIVEMTGFKLSPVQVNMEAEQFAASIELVTAQAWTATSDQSWLTISPTSGNNSQTITLTAEANQSVEERRAIVTFVVADTLKQEVPVIQQPMTVTAEISAGNLVQVIAASNLRNAKRLTLTGQLDARDFRFLRDSMPQLSELDISEVSIVAYQGTEGTINRYTEFPANKVPGWAFYNPTRNQGSKSLRSIILPSSTLAIGDHAFYDCSVLEQVDVPTTVTTIEDAAFSNTSVLKSISIPTSLTVLERLVFYGSGLTSVEIPTSVTFIEDYAFSSCENLVSIEIPSSVTRMGIDIFSNCFNLKSAILPASLYTIPYNTFTYCINLTSVNIPSSVISIETNAFHLCEKLSTISIPASVTFIREDAFANCTRLRSIYAYSANPPVLEGSYNYGSINTDVCILYVPKGSKEKYASAPGWKIFKNIQEIEEFILSPHSLIMEPGQGTAFVQLIADQAWTVSSHQPWLTVNPVSGVGSTVIQISANANESFIARVTEITFSTGNLSQQLTVTQEGLPKLVNLSPGTLSTVLNNVELSSIRNLTITGEMDARDFKTLRDLMPNLRTLDMSMATIVAYSELSTDGITLISYEANKIPNEALVNQYFGSEVNLLASVILPSTITAIGYQAFKYRKGLTGMEIPNGVISLNAEAFMLCEGLRWISIPPTVTDMEYYIIHGCKSLNAVYMYPVTPPVLNAPMDNFAGIDKNNCTLYVPQGSKQLYETANYWKEFIHIVEMDGFNLSSNSAITGADDGNSVSANLVTESTWQAVSDQYWLKVFPDEGTCAQSLLFTVLANPEEASRTATVTFTAPGLNPRTFVVTQQGLTTDVTEIDQNKAVIKCYPNPFNQYVTIEISNPELSNVIVEIYNIAGQKIKTLARAQKEANMILTWDGCNEQGVNVIPGIYLFMVNGQVIKVVKQGKRQN